jgi:hypothetical protein
MKQGLKYSCCLVFSNEAVQADVKQPPKAGLPLAVGLRGASLVASFAWHACHAMTGCLLAQPEADQCLIRHPSGIVSDQRELMSCYCSRLCLME